MSLPKVVYPLLIVCLLFIVIYLFHGKTASPVYARPDISQLSHVYELFPASQEGVDVVLAKALEQAKTHLDILSKVDDRERTFSNTLVALDKAVEELNIAQAALYVLSLASPDEKVRAAATQAVNKLRMFMIDSCSLNEHIYKAVSAYQKRLTQEKHETLAAEEEYFLRETLNEFKRNGLELPYEQQKRVREIQKEWAQLALDFDKAISASRSTLKVSRDELKGLDDSFIQSLQRVQSGKYLLTVDQALVLKVLERCEVVKTRKDIYRLFMRRAYPENEKVLERILVLGDELAHILGYASYAHYALDDQMAKTPERVQQFLSRLFELSIRKAQDELNLLKSELPPSVVLKDGKIQPWDVAFVYDAYKRKHFNLDETEIEAYFPLEYTLPALLRVYEDFFGISFVKVKKVYLWHEDVRAYAVYKKGHYRGIIILDLFPRSHKFTHAGHVTIVPSVYDAGKLLPGVSLLLANFTPAQGDRPALLKRSDVTIFFHEFGHALHALLGTTKLASTAGTATKQDFIEMPSQMLEEWLWDPEILKAVSSHMVTHEPLPEHMIRNIISSKHLATGDNMLRQITLSLAALGYYLPKSQKSLGALWQDLHTTFRINTVADPENKGYCSFVHLTGYGPRYYGYLWSKVYALDLFSKIQPYGLRNGEIGDSYVATVLSKGGSADPNDLLKAFLGRAPSPDAFFKDLGL